MGIVDMFTGAADFSDLLEEKNVQLFVSDVFHKAFIEIDESGTEAGAATGMILSFLFLFVIDLLIVYSFICSLLNLGNSIYVFFRRSFDGSNIATIICCRSSIFLLHMG